MALLEPEHLRARAEAEAELRDHRRGLQPAARRRGRDHVAVPVDDVEMHRVAAHRAHALAPARPARRIVVVMVQMRRRSARRRRWPRPRRAAVGGARLDRLAEALDRARAQLERGASPMSLRALGVVGVRQQRLDRHVDEFRDRRRRCRDRRRRAWRPPPGRWMKSGPVGSRPSRSKPLQQRELLQGHQPLGPGPALSTV